MFETHIALQSPAVSPKCVIVLTGKPNGNIPSTDNRHRLRLILEIEEAIRIDAKRWDLHVRRLLYPWPDHRVLGRIGREGDG